MQPARQSSGITAALLGALVLTLALGASSPALARRRRPAPNASFAYLVSSDSSNLTNGTVSVFAINSSTGVLKPQTNLNETVGLSACSAAVTPAQNFLYVTDLFGSRIFGFAVNSSSGALTAVPRSPFPAGNLSPDSIVVHPSGKFLYALGNGEISVFSIDPSDGSLTALQPELNTDGVGSSMAVNPAGTFLYLSNSSSARTEVFPIAQTGELLPAVQNVNAFGGNLAMAPSGNFLYATSDALLSFTIDADNGFLTPLGATLLFSGSANAAELTPTGNFLFVGLFAIVKPNNTIKTIVVNTTTGLPSSLQGSRHTPVPIGSLATDPTGTYLYAVLPDTDAIASYKIGKAGHLAPIAHTLLTSRLPAQALITIGPALRSGTLSASAGCI